MKMKSFAKKGAFFCGVVVLVLAGGGGITGCKKAETTTSNKLVVWSFTDEIGGLVDNYYKPAHPDVTIEYSLTPTDQFPNKLDPVLASGQGAPDVFGLEDAFVRKYVESGLLLDITDVYEAAKDKILQYPVDIGSYNGKVYGMSWQATPGAVFYRRSLAKKYLGTDDPAVVQTYFKDFETFLATAGDLKTKSNGACVAVSAFQDMLMPYKAARAQPWVVNGKLVIDPAMEGYLDTVKLLYDKGYVGRVQQWSEGWFAGMQGKLTDERNAPIEVFAYFLPTWGLHYVLKTNAPETSGDWAMIPGPMPYRWGGTWLAAWKNTKNPEGAKELISYLTTDDAFLETYAKASGDLIDNIKVVDKIKDDFSEPFLGGQNHYAAFAELAKDVNGKLTQGTDQAIEALFLEATNAYVNGEKSKTQVIEDFKSQVNAQLGL
ncbi:MAG: ABC transporter substrate-binding protein [Spirochaetaceae bacterium]|jgi:ABC-type glycerol-3-phosphate transport system substrate-binding protein|nr:ABC transporter substrate-binding protein [Spirochaetaceae bacterium]